MTRCKDIWRPWGILFKSVCPDLASFTWWQVILLLLFICASVVFSFVDFCHFVDEASCPSISSLENDIFYGIEPWRRALKALSGAASFTGVMSVVLTSKGKVSLYFWGIINCITYGLFAFAYGYAGDTMLNLFFFLPMQFIGLYQWVAALDRHLRSTQIGTNESSDYLIQAFEKEGGRTISPRKLTWVKRFLVLVVCGLLTTGFWFLIPRFATTLAGSYFFEGMTLPRLIDSLTSGLSVVAQTLLLFQYEEQWLLWFTVDVLAIIQWSGVSGLPVSPNALIMWSLFLVNTFFGYYNWRRLRKKREEEEREHDMEQGEAKLHSGDDEVQPPQSQIIENAPKRRGCCMGKFYPFHMGHQHLFTQAQSMCDELYIIVVYLPDEKPEGALRATWVQECNPNATVLCKEDKYHTESSQVWGSLSVEWLGFCPDLVFTREDYGEPWAEVIRTIQAEKSYPPSPFGPCKHVRVEALANESQDDRVRGTEVRANPLGYWNYLPAPVKGYCALRIVVLGSESTGKTTLCQTLARHFHSEWVPEYGAEFCETILRQRGGTVHDLPGGSFPISHEDFLHIVQEQAEREERLARLTPNGVLFCDTNVVASVVWYERYVTKPAPESFLSLVEKLVKPPTLYLLSDVSGTEFVQNGIRDGAGLREAMHAEFVSLMQKSDVPCVILRGSYSQRENVAIHCVQALLKTGCLPTSVEVLKNKTDTTLTVQ